MTASKTLHMDAISMGPKGGTPMGKPPLLSLHSDNPKGLFMLQPSRNIQPPIKEKTMPGT
jgi:hypothetical protein